MPKHLIIILFLFVFSIAYAQETARDSIKDDEMYLAAVKPIKVAFYSAVLPGLGQAYNRDYWKIPVVYAALGTGVYFYVDNNKDYQKYRTAFKLLKLGLPNDYPNITAETLQSAQEYHKKYRDLSVLVTAGLYALQIVEATVDAHLYYHNIDDELTIAPCVIPVYGEQEPVVGVSLTYTF